MKTNLSALFFLCFFFLQTTLFGQDVQQLRIAAIEVVGNSHSETSAIIAHSGLRVGATISIPGNQLAQAVKALWKMQLYRDVQIFKTRQDSQQIFLQILVEEAPRLGNFKILGVKKSQLEELRNRLSPWLMSGTILTPHQQQNSKAILLEDFRDRGYTDVDVKLRQIPSLRQDNAIDLSFEVIPGKRSKLSHIHLSGNQTLSDRKLRRMMKTKAKKWPWQNAQVRPEKLAADRAAILQRYHSLGYRDVQITHDSLWHNETGDWEWALQIEEGQRFFLGQLSWHGHSLYSTQTLNEVLGLKSGDIYDPELLQSRLQFSPDGRDISALYLDRGYLFFRVEAVETAIRDSVIDLEIRIQEGPQATIDEVIITGNNRTHEEVIRRELRTQPGDQFSRADIIRSQRELINLGYFDPQSIQVNTPVDPVNGTVDIEYVLEEKNSDQLELAATWAGPEIGLTGTVGVSFNNFSLRNFLDLSTWNPLPSGDGQTLSLRAQSNGRDYQSYNLAFTEPWLGGKKPQSLSFALFYNIDQEDGFSETQDERFELLGASLSLGRRTDWLDGTVISTTALNAQRYRLTNWGDEFFQTDGGQSISNGVYHKISLQQTFARSTLNHPFFPTSGSLISLSGEFTLPYSKWNKVEDDPDQSPEEKYRWIEYYKLRFDASWYKQIVGKLVLKTSIKMGYLGNYNQALGHSPFERFQLGGDGMSNLNSTYTGTDVIALRGYEVEDLENNLRDGSLVANPLFQKLTAELRYPILTNPSAQIYSLLFVEAGNSWQSLDDYQPFDLKRSVGVGLRAQLPMLGIIGFDYGLGFDKAGDQTWKNFAKFSLIFGFEPD